MCIDPTMVLMWDGQQQLPVASVGGPSMLGLGGAIVFRDLFMACWGACHERCRFRQRCNAVHSRLGLGRLNERME